MSGLRVVLLGRQGAGKGTQGALLAAHLGVPHVSTGDMLRAAVREGSAVGQRAARYLEAGELVPDEVIVAVVRERLAAPDAATGVILDGFPRTVAQADALETALAPRRVDVALEIDVPLEEVHRRLASRRVCPACGWSGAAPDPDVASVPCGGCGAAAVRRADDTPEAIRRRLEINEAQAAPLRGWFASRHRLVTVDGTGSPSAVLERALAALGRLSPAA